MVRYCADESRDCSVNILRGLKIFYLTLMQLHSRCSDGRRAACPAGQLLCCSNHCGSITSHRRHDLCTSIYLACWSNRSDRRSDWSGLHQGSAFCQARAFKCEGEFPDAVTVLTLPYTPAQAPVVAAINGAFTGLVSIRAFEAQTAFMEQTEETVNRYTRISISFFHLTRWVTVRMQVAQPLFPMTAAHPPLAS
jgi:hypothetical protein